MRPARAWCTVRPAPHASTRATTSPGPGTGSDTFSTTRGVLAAFNTTAFMRSSSQLPTDPRAALRSGAGLGYYAVLSRTTTTYNEKSSAHGSGGARGCDRRHFFLQVLSGSTG